MSTYDPLRILHHADFSQSDEPEEDFATTLDNFFSSQRPVFSLSEKIWTPPTDVFEIGTTVYVVMEVAGIDERDLEIAVDKNLLRVRGVRHEKHPSEKKATYHLMEIRYGNFERVFGLPSNLNVDSISANYRDGFLCIEIPRIIKAPREIPIEVD